MVTVPDYDYAPISTFARAFVENPHTQSADQFARQRSPSPQQDRPAKLIDEQDIRKFLESERFTQFADTVAQLLKPVFEGDYQWDSTAVGRWETLAKTVPSMVTRSSIVVERGKPHFKGPPLVECPRCKTKLTRGTATLTFRHAPAATQLQQVEAWVCSCGEFYVPGEIARTAYLRAFQRSPNAGEGLQRAFGAWAGDAEELEKFLQWNREQRKVGRRGMDD